MKLSEFIRLNEEEKRSTVLQQGVPVAKRQLVDYMVFLFQLSGYYVETYCCQQTKEIHEYRTIHSIDHLSLYLDAIPIDHLLKD
jgi:hypothetical protein